MKGEYCGTEFQGEFCSSCGAPATKSEQAEKSTIKITVKRKNSSIQRKWWFWVIVVVVVMGLYGAAAGGDTTDTGTTNSSTSQQADVTSGGEQSKVEQTVKVKVVDFSAMSKSEIETWASQNNIKCEFVEEYSDSVATGAFISQSKKANETVKEGTTIKIVISKGKEPPVEYQNALKKAESYSNNLHMSKARIYRQLTSEYGEKFSADAAQYAIDNLKADFKANALASAKSYQENLNMSKQRIYDQLISEYGGQFTEEEAQYAIDNLED